MQESISRTVRRCTDFNVMLLCLLFSELFNEKEIRFHFREYVDSKLAHLHEYL